MKRIDIRVYVDDGLVDVPVAKLEETAKQLTNTIVENINESCSDHCPEGFVTVVYKIGDGADYPHDLYL